MREAFELPDLGEGIAEGELVAWHVAPGDVVAEDNVIAEVETDKALVDIPSPFDGEIVELGADEGELVPVGEELVVFEVEGGEATAEPEPPAPDEDAETGDGRPFARPHVRRLAREKGVELASLGTDGEQITEADVLAAVEGAEPTEEPTTERDHPVEPADTGTRDRTLAAPATRRIAREEGVDINVVPASEEREGEAFVTPEDVRAAAAGEHDGAPAPTESEPVDGTSPGERIPYTGIRRTIGERMVTSKFTAPHVSHHDEVDVSELVAIRERLKEPADAQGVDLTYLPFAVKAATAALQEVPAINAELDEDAEEIILHDEYHIGIAVAAEAGLMVPVIENADRKGLLEIAAEIADKAERARNRSIDVSELRGSTFTITNVGALGGMFASPIINYPEAAILALGSIEERPWVLDGEVVARHTMPISMTSDHRIVDGAEAAQFTNALKRYLHDPTLLLLE